MLNGKQLYIIASSLEEGQQHYIENYHLNAANDYTYKDINIIVSESVTQPVMLSAVPLKGWDGYMKTKESRVTKKNRTELLEKAQEHRAAEKIKKTETIRKWNDHQQIKEYEAVIPAIWYDELIDM